LLKLLPGVEGLIAGLEPLDREVLQNSDLKVISRCGSGMTNVDLNAAKELGIKVFNTPDGPKQAVAELTIGCLLSLIRQVPEMDRALHGGRWDKRVGRQLKEMTVLIIGYGNIGRTVGALLTAMGAHILISDPAFKGNDSQSANLEIRDALAQADAITLHCSGEDSILNQEEFNVMKEGAFLLNAARGSLVDEQALCAALDSGKVAGAWLDTFAQEPYEGSLSRYEQVILTPHVGSYTCEGRLRMESDCVQNLLRGFEEME
jgi:D-3-phosphoglycerate dehydrogenase